MADQSSTLVRNLSDAQEQHAAPHPDITTAIVYRLYTEDRFNLGSLTARYFPGATLFFGDGLWKGEYEKSATIEIIGTIADYQSVVFLAGDIKTCNDQSAVLITKHRVDTFAV